MYASKCKDVYDLKTIVCNHSRREPFSDAHMWSYQYIYTTVRLLRPQLVDTRNLAVSHSIGNHIRLCGVCGNNILLGYRYSD